MTVGATVAGTIMGTLGYMAPEQAKGKPVDKRADIWAWGQWVAFVADGKLRKVPVNGGAATDICEIPVTNRRVWGGSFGASWASNNTIVVALGRQGIMQVPADGGATQLLVRPAKSGESYRTPQLLPDGKTLLFTLAPPNDDLQAVARRIDSGEQRMLLKGGATDARLVSTGQLVYEQNATLMAVPFDSKRMQLAGSPVAILTGVMQARYEPNGAVDTGMGQFAFSSSGHLVYASGGISPTFIYSIVRVDRKGVETDLKAPKAPYIVVRVSPDGQKIAVFKGGNFGGIWIVDASSGNSIRLTPEGYNTWPLWSPDGKRIIYSEGSRFTAITADGSGTIVPLAGRVAAPGSFAYAASWSADGKWLAYLETASGISRIWTMPMPGPGEPMLFAESKFGLGYVELSPDGHWILYSSSESGDTEVYVQAFPGPGEKHRISTSGGSNAAWARNGREVFYLEPRPAGKLAMMAADFTPGVVFKAGTPHELFEGPLGATTPLRSYDVTPDGQHFIMLRTEPPPNQPVTRLNVVLNWFDELKRLPRGR